MGPDEVTWLFRTLSGKWACRSLRFGIESCLSPSWTLPLFFRNINGAPWSCHFIVVGRHTVVPPIPNSSARCQNLVCFSRVIVKLSGCQGLTWPSNVTRVDAKDLCCPTTLTSSYGSANHISPELIVKRASHAAPAWKMAVLPETREGNVHIYNESARGWSLREANV